MILHSSYCLLIFQLVALATALVKFLTFFSPFGFFKQPRMFLFLGPASRHQQQGYTAPSGRLEGVRFEQQNPAGAFL